MGKGVADMDDRYFHFEFLLCLGEGSLNVLINLPREVRRAR
jgi:hypothetical protein